MWKIANYLIFLLIFSNSFSDSTLEVNRANVRNLAALLDETIQAAEKIFHFFVHHIDESNLDVGLGIGNFKGVVRNLVERYSDSLPSDVVYRLSRLNSQVDGILTTIGRIVKHKTPEYYKSASPFLNAKIWDRLFPYKRISPNYAKQIDQREFMTEQQSDKCASEIMANQGDECPISKDCVKQMLTPGFSYYSLTHQLLYLALSLQTNCSLQLQKIVEKQSPLRETVNEAMDRLCSDIYDEAKMIERSGFNVSDRDLFMEQIGLCGFAGYLDIAELMWLPHILSWQQPNGCYTVFQSERINPKNFESDRYGNTKRRKRSSHHQLKVIAKRNERYMLNGKCLAHRTSVALSALTTYIRKLTELLYAD